MIGWASQHQRRPAILWRHPDQLWHCADRRPLQDRCQQLQCCGRGSWRFGGGWGAENFSQVWDHNFVLDTLTESGAKDKVTSQRSQFLKPPLQCTASLFMLKMFAPLSVTLSCKNVEISFSSQWISHPSYRGNDNDFAIIKLSRPVTFSSSVLPACLPDAGKNYDG